MKDPDAFMSELSGAEQACVSDYSDPRRLMALMSAPELASSEETAKLIQCLGDETLLRLFLTGLIGQTGPLTEETSKCVRSGFADFDVRAVRPAGVVVSAMVGDIAAFLLTLSCLNEEEWQAVGPSLEMGPDDRESLQCLIKELGGSEGIAAALQPDDGGPPTDYIRAKIACGLQSSGDDDSNTGGVGDDLDLVWVGSVNDVEFTASDLVQRIRVLQGSKLLSNADRAMLNTYGVNGGKPGSTYAVSVTDPDATRRDVPGMVDNVDVAADSVVRIVTTGGGGWGDPLGREPERVCYDVQCGVVSEAAARNDYGVALHRKGAIWQVDEGATTALRAELRRGRAPLAMFDRGGYFEAKKAAGEVHWPDGWADPDEGWLATPPAAGREAAE